MTKKYSIKDYIYLGLMSLLGVFTIVLGLFFIFTTDIRSIQNDSTRASDFSAISYQVEQYISSKGKFPASIAELERMYPSSSYYSTRSSGKSIYKDPETGNFYDLKYKNDNKNYEICGTFQTDYKGQAQGGVDMYYGSRRIEFKKGYYCEPFELERYYIDILEGKNDPIKPFPEPMRE